MCTRFFSKGFALLLLAILSAPPVSGQDSEAAAERKFEAATRALDAEDFAGAVELLTQAIELNPRDLSYLNFRAGAYMRARKHYQAWKDYDDIVRMVESGKASVDSDWLGTNLFARAHALIALSEYDRAWSDLERSRESIPGELRILSSLGEICNATGRYEEAVAWFQKALEALRGLTDPVSVDAMLVAQSLLSEALQSLHRYDEALAVLERMRTDHRGATTEKYYWPMLAVLRCMASDPKHQNVQEAAAICKTHLLSGEAYALGRYAVALTYYFSGNAKAAVDFLASFHLEGTFHKARLIRGFAYHDLGEPEKAAESLVPAFEINAVVREKHRSNPALAYIYRILEQRQQDRSGKDVTERERIRLELASYLALDRQIDGFVVSYRFDQAADELQALAGRLKTERVQREAAERLKSIQALGAIHAKISAAVRDPQHKITLTINEDLSGEVVEADADEIVIHFKGAKVKKKWLYVSPEQYLKMVREVRLDGFEKYALGRWCWQRGERQEARRLLIAAHKDKEHRELVDAFVAQCRELPVPEGGFVVYKEDFVTPDEASHLKKHEVWYNGKWVTESDHRHLVKGHQKIDGKWVPLTEKQLIAQGFVKHQGEWKSLRDVRRLAHSWEDAWERETPHFKIRTNTSEQTLDLAASVLEAAYAEFVKRFGKELSRKMVVLAMHTHEDYRAYCVKVNATGVLNALGFAPSERDTCVGYDKFSNQRIFLQTLVHEATHLYLHMAFEAPMPSWLSEGIATYFEGFEQREGRWVFHLPAEGRMDYLKHDLASGGAFEPAKLIDGDAGVLINQSATGALDFYAEAWATVFYLFRTTDAGVRESFEALIRRANRRQPLKVETSIDFDLLRQEVPKLLPQW